MKNVKMKIIKDERKIEEILEEGLNCEYECTVGEVVDIIATMAEHIKKSGAYQKLVCTCGESYEEAIQDFIISFVCSEIATITGEFIKRDLPCGKA